MLAKLEKLKKWWEKVRKPEKTELTAEDVDIMCKKRGTYKTFFKCKSCDAAWEVIVPKGCRYYLRGFGEQPSLYDEESKLEWFIYHSCFKCDTCNIEIRPDLIDSSK